MVWAFQLLSQGYFLPYCFVEFRLYLRSVRLVDVNFQDLHAIVTNSSPIYFTAILKAKDWSQRNYNTNDTAPIPIQLKARAAIFILTSCVFVVASLKSAIPGSVILALPFHRLPTYLLALSNATIFATAKATFVHHAWSLLNTKTPADNREKRT